MPDLDTRRPGRICPACDRRVPRSVAKCRCGAILPAEDIADVPGAEIESSTDGSRAIVAIAIVAIAAGAGYWMFMRPVAVPVQIEKAAVNTPHFSATAAAAADASPAARAWDAAAKAQAAPASSDTVTPTPYSPPTIAPLSAAVEDMVDRVMPAVVLIETTGGRGSGFYIAHDTLITNVHVVQNDSYVTLRRMDGSSVTARVANKAPAFDIAILKVASPSASQAVIPMGSAHALKPGQEIIVIGSALGTLQNSVSRGIVSGLRTAGGATLVQTDAATNPGNSGGPMLDRNGAVVGITTMGYKNAEGLNFGVAIDHARDLLEGRTASLGTTAGLSDIQSRSKGSESDRQQQQGEEQFRGGMGQMADAARNVDAAWQRFRDQCFKDPIGGNYQREWFAVLVPRALPGNAGAGCASYYSSLETDIKQFRGFMQRLLSDARRANVLPGTIRDQLRNNRLDFEW
jgi:S1-C subfamily serine protease